MISNEEVLIQSTNIISSFLKREGGASNGYQTYVEGSVEKDHHRLLQWSTPDQQNYLLRDINSKGYNLYEDLLSVLEKSDATDIVVAPIYDGDGCYHTMVSVNTKISKRVSLY